MKVVKRTKNIVYFDPDKIKNAIKKAFKSCNKEYKITDIELISCNVIKTILDKNLQFMNIEEIQDLVENEIMISNNFDVAKSYILYREKRSESRKNKVEMETIINMFDDYIGDDNWEINENSNTSYSLQGMNNNIVSEFTKYYWLNKIYTEEMKEKHDSGDFHIHDLNLLANYCCGWDLYDFLVYGMTGVYGKISSKPAKHLKTALMQCVNLLYSLQQESSGAMALSNFDTLLAPFIRYDNLSYKEVKQCLQEFIFNMNVSTRTGFQSCFSNLTMDLECPSRWKDEKVIYGGKKQKETYKEFQNEMDMINEAFCEVMYEGDSQGRPFSFPIPTYNIDKGFNWDNPKLEKLWDVTRKFGTPYFANYMNSDMTSEDAKSMCPLHPDEKVYILDKNGKEKKVKISTLKNGKEYKVLSKEKYLTGIFQKHKNKRYYEITLYNGERIVTSSDHLNFVKKSITGNVLEIQSQNLDNSYFLPCFLSLGNLRFIDKYKKDEIVFEDKENGFCWIRILDVLDTKETGDAYCFEIKDGDPMFLVAESLIYTHNCRLRIDTSKLLKRGGGLFGSNSKTGSIGVVTINIPALAYKNKGNIENFYKELKEMMVLAKDSLEIKRKVIEENANRGLYPYSKFYLKDIKKSYGGYFENHFSTIGLVGMNEACLNMFDKDIVSKEGKEFAINIMNFMRDIVVKFQEETNHFYNLEATPAESTSYRLALKDKKRFQDIIQAGEEDTYYTNSTQLPVEYTDDLFEAIEHQNDLQSLYTGGTVLHAFIGEKIYNNEQVKNIIRKIFENYTLPYLSITPTFSICPEHGYISGEHKTCPYDNKNIDK